MNTTSGYFPPAGSPGSAPARLRYEPAFVSWTLLFSTPRLVGPSSSSANFDIPWRPSTNCEYTGTSWSSSPLLGRLVPSRSVSITTPRLDSPETLNPFSSVERRKP